MFIRPGTSCILIHANTYETTSAIIQKISPNRANSFWNCSTIFNITLRVIDLKVKPELYYPESLNIEKSSLFVQRDDDLIVFHQGYCKDEDLDGLTTYDNRVLNCTYIPCPPEIAKEIGEKAGLFKTQHQIEDEKIAAIEDPTIRRLKKILRNLEREENV